MSKEVFWCPLYNKILLSMSFLAVCSDLHTEKIPNGGILCFWIIGFFYQSVTNGWHGVLQFFAGAVLPVVTLFLLFTFRMLGAGDIKLLSVLGGIMGPGSIFQCILYSFIIGAVISAAVLTATGMLYQRLRYFAEYFQRIFVTRSVISYRKSGKQFEHIHFSVPVFLAVILHTGGIY